MNISKQKRSFKMKVIKNIQGLLTAIVIALLVRMFIIEPYKIPSESMYPNLIKEDMIMASKFTYGVFLPIVNVKIPGFIEPKSGDIALFQTPTYHSPGKLLEIINFLTFGILQLDNNDEEPKFFIKRVIGTPGSQLYIANPSQTREQFQIIYNGKPLKLTPYNKKMDFEQSGEYKYFVEHGANKDYVVQFLDKKNSGFSFGYEGFLGDVYIPKKGDKLKFIVLINHSQKKEIQNLRKKGVMPSISPKDEFKLVVVNHQNQQIHLNFLAMNTFYYTQQVNTVLSSDDLYNLFENGEVIVNVDSDYFLMMGDNRDNSSDSRYWGFVKEKYIMGNPLGRYYPFGRFGRVNIL